MRIFKQEGVDLGDVVIGHAGDSNDLGYLTELADQGVLLGMENPVRYFMPAREGAA